MEIENKEFFHIHRIGLYSSHWKKGNKLDWKNKLNSFAEIFMSGGIVYNDGTGELNTRAALHRFINGNKEYKNKEIAKIFNLCDSTINELTTCIREIVFEQVRKEQFPFLPSRHYCVWVCRKEFVSYWWQQLKGNKKIFKLKLTGTIHIADDKYLENDTFSLNEFKINALRYWQGIDKSEFEAEEILFKGMIEILDEFKSCEDFLAI